MQYSTLLALLSAPLLSLAQSTANPFSIPDAGISATGGKPLNLEWNPTTDGTVTLVLRSGSSNDLNEGTVIASSIDNSGSYTWTPSDSLTRGSDYTVEIVDDNDPTNVNYTPYFVLDTDTTTVQQTSIVSLGQAATTTPELSTASPTGAATSLTDVQTLATSASGAMTTAGNSLVTTISPVDSTAGSSASGAMNTAGSSASSAASDAGSSASASSDLNAPEQSGNAGSKNTVVVGVLGAVALGAFAL